MYLKSDDFWALGESYMIFKKNALHFWLIMFDFFLKYNRTGVFNQSKIGNEDAAKFQNKMHSLTVSFCHVTYAFQDESTLYSCLSVKERSKQAQNLKFKWLRVNGWVFVYELSGCEFESSRSHFKCIVNFKNYRCRKKV